MHRQAALARPGSAKGITSAIAAIRMAHGTNSLAILMDLVSCPTSHLLDCCA